MIQISGFLADNRILVALAKTSWLILAVWGFAPPHIKTMLSANAWLLMCVLTRGPTISLKYISVQLDLRGCLGQLVTFCWHIPIHRWIYLQKHSLEQCTNCKGAHADKWSAFFADFTPPFKLEVDMIIIIQQLNGLHESSLSHPFQGRI